MVYALMLAFLIANGALIDNVLYADLRFAIGMVSYLAVGLLLITLTSRIRIAKPLRWAGWVVVLLGIVGTLIYLVPDDFNYLRQSVVGSSSSAPLERLFGSWFDAWITLGVFVQLFLLIGLALSALRRLNEFLLQREQPPRIPGVSSRVA